MSNKQNLERKLNNAERTWEEIQIRAASAQRELDYAVAVFEKHKAELQLKELEQTTAQIEVQRKAIKDYLEKGKTAYAQDIVRLTGALARLEEKNA